MLVHLPEHTIDHFSDDFTDAGANGVDVCTGWD